MVNFLRKTLLVSAIFSGSIYAGTLPAITAQSWLVADEFGTILKGNNTTDIRSIASITKLMTVMVVLDAQQDLNEIISTKLYNRKLSRRELIALSIVKSDNNAARILCESYVTGTQGCIKAMNDKATSLEMYSTYYVEPTGLYNENVSTAENLIKLVIAASKYPIINEDSNKEKFTLTSKKNITQFSNTNTLVGKGYNFVVSKTGWIRRSGGCIVMMLTTEKGIRTVILLGSKTVQSRIPEAKLIAISY